MTDLRFEKFKGKTIPVLDWTFESNVQIIDWLTDNRDDVEFLATDLKGDYVCLSNSKIVIVDHEHVDKVNDYEIGSNISQVVEMLNSLQKLPEYNEDTQLNELRKIKSELKRIKKFSPKTVDFCFDDELDEINELIDDWEFYQTKEGKIYLELVKYQKLIKRLLDQPDNHNYFQLAHRVEDDKVTYYFSGYCNKPDEDIDHVKSIIESIDFPHELVYKSLLSYQEYLELMVKTRNVD